MKITKSQNFLLLSTLILLASCGNNNESREIKREGKVKLEAINIAPKIAGKIESIRIQEGQQVRKGDTLAIIAVPEISAKLQQANGAVEAASGQLQLANNGATTNQLLQIESQLEAAQAQMEFAEKSYGRIQNMYLDSLVPAQQFDEVKSKYDMARAQVNTLHAKQKEVNSGTRKETIQSAEGQMMRAQGARNEVLQAEQERYIIAPADMLIETVNLKVGELATPGYTIVTGTTNDATYFRFTVGESKINAYSIGQELNVSVPNTNKMIASKIVAVKQMPRYADNTSTAPNRQVGEGFYELKIMPINPVEAIGLYNNSTVFISK